MAEAGDGGNSRMLFTDMDVSDKGRPEAAPEEIHAQTYTSARRRLLTIDDILSNLELDFEEDADSGALPAMESDADGAEPVPPSATESKEGEAPPGDTRGAGRADSEGRAATAGPEEPAAATGISGRLPTWEQYARAFRSSSTAMLTKDPHRGGGAVVPSQAEDHDGKREPASPDGQAGDAAVVEDGQDADAAIPAPGGEAMAEAAPAPTADAALDAILGAMAGSGASDPWFPIGLTMPDPGGEQDPDDPDLDILSYLPPLPPEVMGAVPEWRGGRLGVGPPPEEAYGGLERVDDWYMPPEDGGPPHPPSGDWFEPPEPGSGDTERLLRDLAALDPNDPAFPAMPGDGGPTRRFTPPPPPGTSSGADPETRTVDLFSGVDLEALWRAKIAREEKPSLSDTHFLDLLESMAVADAMDTESPQAEARQTRILPAGGRPDPGQPDTNDPRYARTEPAPDDTAILSMEDILAKPLPAPPPRFPEAVAAAAPAWPPSVPSDEEAEEPEAILEPSLTGHPAAPAGTEAASRETGETGDAVPGSRPSTVMKAFGLDDLDIDSLLLDDEPSDTVVIQAPIISNDDISEIPDGATKRRKRKTVSQPDAEKGQEDGEEEDYIPGAPADSPDGAAEAFPDDDDAAAVEEEPQAEVAPGPRGITPEDLLRDLDLDDGPAVNDRVSAPVIDDSAIDDLESGPTDTEELQALDDWQRPKKPSADRGGVDPESVFAALDDDMDFSDGLEEDDEEEEDGAEEAGDDGAAEPEAVAPGNRAARAWSLAGASVRWAVRTALRPFPEKWVARVESTLALEENWRIYCDLAAAIIASASLAVILSYHIWYRN